MNFNTFRQAIDAQFALMQVHQLFVVDVPKQDLWDTYLAAFPEGSNPIYRERTHHDCQCCKQFIRTVGNVVAIIDGRLQSIWHVELPDDEPEYQIVANIMAALVEEATILHPFFHYQRTLGVRKNHSQEEDGSITTWDHYAVRLPDTAIVAKDHIPSHLSKLTSKYQVFQRSLEEITEEAVETVLELIGQKSLYRGEEHISLLTAFQTCQTDYKRLEFPFSRPKYLWAQSKSANPALLGIRNTAIGTLLVDLSEGRPLDEAVGAFEAKVAPANYKRPTALITPTMIKKAQEKVEELGFANSLPRRHAVMEDITVPNVIFANRAAKKIMEGDVFSELIEAQPVNPQNLSKVEEIDIDTFISEVVPQATKIEVLMENRQVGNLMTLVAPVHSDAPCMLKWDNNFSWAYNGDVTDSMKERVKAAGGNVEGVLRFSIQWNDDEEYNYCDYDAHCIEPSGNRLYYMNPKISSTTGELDVDIIHPEEGKAAVENITWTDARKMQKGEYQFLVHCYSARQGNDGFSAEFEFNGQVHHYVYAKTLRQDKYVEILRGHWDGENFEITKQLPSALASRTVWDLPTMQYHNVSLMMLSPNHWDENNVGNKHYFFILESCRQPGKIRGFYNEFLKFWVPR
jgi:hypothetical protein